MHRPNANQDSRVLYSRFEGHQPTTFVRFSDGELEIIRNNPILIKDGVVQWSRGTLKAGYPQHDSKSFVPNRDQALRADLIASATYRSPGYFKGTVTSSNRAVEDRNYMIELNGGDTQGLTFTDLFINENYLWFLRQVLPLFTGHKNVTFLGNFRAEVSNLSSDWSHIPLGDDVFPDYKGVMPLLISRLQELGSGSVVLSSASSLSNILGHKLHQTRPDITFVDVGTSLNPFIGLGRTTRAYQTQLLPWNSKNISRKLKYQLFGNHRMKW